MAARGAWRRPPLLLLLALLSALALTGSAGGSAAARLGTPAQARQQQQQHQHEAAARRRLRAGRPFPGASPWGAEHGAALSASGARALHQAAPAPAPPSPAARPPLDWAYQPRNASEALQAAMESGMSVPDGVELQRWVRAAWSVSNFSNLELLEPQSLQEMSRVIDNVTNLAPWQVRLYGAANVTVGFILSGITPREVYTWIPRHLSMWDATMAGVMRDLAVAAAPGFRRDHVAILFEAPDFGLSADKWVASGNQSAVEKQVQDVPRQQQQQQQQEEGAASGAGSPGAVAGRGGSRRLLGSRARRLLQAAAPLPPSQRVVGNVRGLTPVWVVYEALDPVNVSSLLSALGSACGGGGRELAAGLDITGSECGEAIRRGLAAASIKVNDSSWAVRLFSKPVVSLNVQLLVGITETQAAEGVDDAVAQWLGQPGAVQDSLQAAGSSFGPNALIKWLQTPEIWSNVTDAWRRQPSGPFSHTGYIVALAFGVAGMVGVVAGVVAFMLSRWHRRRRARMAAAAAADKPHAPDGGSADGSHRRRRKQGKRRYLLPDLPAPSATVAAPAPGAGGDAGAGSSAAAAAAAAANGSSFSSDHLRPAMKELGDSVTSAVRFEQDSDEEEGGADGDGAGPQRNPSLRRVGAAAAAAVAGAAAAAAATRAGSRDRAPPGKQPSIAERRQQEEEEEQAAAAAAAAAAGDTCNAGGAARLPTADSASRHGRLPGARSSGGGGGGGSSAPAALAGGAALLYSSSAAAASAVGSAASHEEGGGVWPVLEGGQVDPAVLQAHCVSSPPAAPGAARPSPFAVGYDFGGLGLAEPSPAVAAEPPAAAASPVAAAAAGSPETRQRPRPQHSLLRSIGSARVAVNSDGSFTNLSLPAGLEAGGRPRSACAAAPPRASSLALAAAGDARRARSCLEPPADGSRPWSSPCSSGGLLEGGESSGAPTTSSSGALDVEPATSSAASTATVQGSSGTAAAKDAKAAAAAALGVRRGSTQGQAA